MPSPFPVAGERMRACEPACCESFRETGLGSLHGQGIRGCPFPTGARHWGSPWGRSRYSPFPGNGMPAGPAREAAATAVQLAQPLADISISNCLFCFRLCARKAKQSISPSPSPSSSSNSMHYNLEGGYCPSRARILSSWRGNATQNSRLRPSVYRPWLHLCGPTMADASGLRLLLLVRFWDTKKCQFGTVTRDVDLSFSSRSQGFSFSQDYVIIVHHCMLNLLKGGDKLQL